MKIAALGLVACLMFASIGFAQQNAADAPASKEDVQRYLDAVHSREMMENTLSAMMKQMHQMTHEQVLKERNLPADFEAHMDKITDDLFKNFPYEAIQEAMVPVYQKHFTKVEMDALAEFYTAPTGQKILKEMPEVVTEAMQASSGILQKMMSDARNRLQSEIAQARKQTDESPKKESQPISN
jgi:uncharacterized protein